MILFQGFFIGWLLFERHRRQSAEQRNRRQLTAMAHLDRRHAMGQLTTWLAHDLNQPLGAILHNAEVAKVLLARATPPIAELQDIVEGIRRDEARAGEVIRRVCALLCQHDFHYESLNINDVATAAAAVAAQEAAFRGVRMDLELQDAPGVVWGDRMGLQQVLVSLIINSIEAMGSLPRQRRGLVVRTVFNSGSVSVLVNDTGPGFAAEPVSQIFEPFYTTKGDGSGMGLSIARSIVEAHSGRIAAENRLEGGAAVQITVPLRRA